jgi:hypothetical protein
VRGNSSEYPRILLKVTAAATDKKAHAGFEVLIAVVMKRFIFWDITPCSPLKVHRRFGGTCCIHFQGRIISEARTQRESRWQAFRGVISQKIEQFEKVRRYQSISEFSLNTGRIHRARLTRDKTIRKHFLIFFFGTRKQSKSRLQILSASSLYIGM